jgi:hypothetical protein
MEYAHMTISTMIVMNAARSGSAQRHTSHVYVGGGVCGGDGAIISVRLTTNTSVMRVGGGTVVDGGAGAVGVESGQPGASKWRGGGDDCAAPSDATGDGEGECLDGGVAAG